MNMYVERSGVVEVDITLFATTSTIKYLGDVKFRQSDAEKL